MENEFEDVNAVVQAAAPEPAVDDATEELRATPDNFRMIAQVYADQVTLMRRTLNAAGYVLSNAQDSGPSVLFDFGTDPLSELTFNEEILETQTRVVDLLVLNSLGLAIDVKEYQDYAKRLATLYATFDFVNKVRGSQLKDAALAEIEKEWLGGTDFSRVQQFYRYATVAVTEAAAYCGVEIASLPEF